MVQVSALSGGTTEYYGTHIQQAINDVYQTYSLYHQLPEAAVVSLVVNHLASPMSHIVAVNYYVVEKLQSDLDIQLLELKCNVHQLGGISKKCYDVLKHCNRTYSTKSDTFGNDCCEATFCTACPRCDTSRGRRSVKLKAVHEVREDQTGNDRALCWLSTIRLMNYNNY